MIREAVAEALKKILGVGEIPVNVPPRREMGDFLECHLSLACQREAEATHGDCKGGGSESEGKAFRLMFQK